MQAFVGNTSVWLLYGCIAVQSGFYAVNNPARSAMVPRLLDRELIPAAAALNMASFNLGLTLGPLLGALAVEWRRLRGGVRRRRGDVRRRVLRAAADAADAAAGTTARGPA